MIVCVCVHTCPHVRLPQRDAREERERRDREAKQKQLEQVWCACDVMRSRCTRSCDCERMSCVCVRAGDR
jgi:hypothetical protein